MDRPNFAQRIRTGFQLGREYYRLHQYQTYLTRINCDNLATVVQEDKDHVAEMIKQQGTVGIVCSVLAWIASPKRRY